MSGYQFVTSHYINAEYHKNHPHLTHNHTELELLLITGGEGIYMVGGKDYYVVPGSLVICNAGTIHGEKPAQTSEKISYCCVLTGVQMPGMMPNALTHPTENPILFFEKERDALTQIYKALHEYSLRPDAKITCNSLAGAIFQIVLDELNRRAERILDHEKSEEEFVRSIVDYLDQHYTEEVSIEALCERFHISPYYLSQFFKKETGLAPTKYVMMRRIGEAQNLLMNTNLPIGDIGFRLGFEDIAYFSKQFKKYVALTPTEFRTYHRERGM